LHGYTKGHPPRQPGQALEAFLRALGVPAAQIPRDTDACAALYRQCLTDTRTLVLLDNAADEAQVRPLLPGSAGCLLIVTSRRRLKGLDDAHILALDVLPATQAITLLRTVAGCGRFSADDPLLAEIARLCGHLPLALRIAAAVLRHRPAWTLQHLAALLRDQLQRVAALSDGERDLGAVFDLSYTGLDDARRLLFRRLGLVPGPDADAYAAAALLDTDPGAATWLLQDLVDHNLLIEYAPGRYRLHDLIRAHARTLADQDPAEDNQAALDRLLHYYAHTAHTASIPLARYPRPASHGPAPAHAPAVVDHDAARAWLRTERENLEAASAYARMSDLHGHLIALAGGLAKILRTDGPLSRALQLHQAAADSAERHARPAAHANALIDLGVTRGMIGDLPGAIGALSRALQVYRAIGHPHGQGAALTELGIVRKFAGEHREAGDAFVRALEVFRALGHRSGEATVLTELGIVRRFAGDLPAADDALSRALEVYRAIGHPHGEGAALAELGNVRRVAGDYPSAGDALSMAVEVYRAVGHRANEAAALAELGNIWRLAGDYLKAGDALSRALKVFRAIGHRINESYALNYYAATIAATGDLPRAFALYRQALAMNRELNKPDDEAVALEGLGGCHLATGQTEPAASHLHQALEIYQRLGMAPDAERVRTRLANLTTV
jgi:tetratricopeptide (TPR) repeat protein